MPIVTYKAGYIDKRWGLWDNNAERLMEEFSTSPKLFKSKKRAETYVREMLVPKANVTIIRVELTYSI